MQVIDELWAPTANEQRDRIERGLPLTHRLVRLPRLSRRSIKWLGDLEGLVLD